MKLHLLSDLHAEFYKEFPVEKYVLPADVLVLAGDIHVGFKSTDTLVSKFADHYKHVLYVPGNHEHYTDNGLYEFQDKMLTASNAYLLNPDYIVIDGISFTGAMLGTNFRGNPLDEILAKNRINDFRFFSTNELVTKFYSDLNYLETHPADVYITHFPPYKECVHPKYQGNALNPYFVNDIKLRPAGAIWLCGHTHAAMDLQIDGVRVVANPLGYPRENIQFNQVTIEL